MPLNILFIYFINGQLGSSPRIVNFNNFTINSLQVIKV